MSGKVNPLEFSDLFEDSPWPQVVVSVGERHVSVNRAFLESFSGESDLAAWTSFRAGLSEIDSLEITGLLQNAWRGRGVLSEAEIAWCPVGREVISGRVTVAGLRRSSEGCELALVALMPQENRLKVFKEERQFWWNLLESIAVPVFYKDRDGVYRGCNQLFAVQVLGLPREAIVGRTLEELEAVIPLELARTYHAADLDLLGRGGVQRYETEVLFSDGERHPVQFTKSTFNDDQGRIAGLVGVILDLSEQRKYEEELVAARNAAEAAARTKGLFLANVTHEIKTPLTGIMGMLELLQDAEEPHLCSDYLSTALDSAESLSRIVNGVLEYSQAEAGRIRLDESEFCLKEAIDSAVQKASGTIGERRIRVVTDISESVPPKVYADRRRITQVLTILIENAIKFGRRGGKVSLAVRCQPQEPGSELVSFEVRDDGPGIPLDQQDSVFRPFFRGDDSTTRRESGMGLGLAIASKLVSLMGGELCLESRAGEGSVFAFALSFERARGHEKLDTDLPLSVSGKVLVVDDNEVNRRLVRVILETIGLTVETASGGLAAFRKLEQGHFDVVLMDLEMPDLDGLETVRRIREWEARNQIESPVAVFALTAHDSSDARQACLEVGMSGYLEKPLRRPELLRAVAGALQARTR